MVTGVFPLLSIMVAELGIALGAAQVFPFLLSRSLKMVALYESQDAHFVFARDAKASLTPTATQKVTLIVAGCYIVAIAILWWVNKWYDVL